MISIAKRKRELKKNTESYADHVNNTQIVRNEWDEDEKRRRKIDCVDFCLHFIFPITVKIVHYENLETFSDSLNILYVASRSSDLDI